jgi:gluconokinase
MGVSGCGKSTIGLELAKNLNYQFVEADDFHSSEAKAHMGSGRALDDTMREPWLKRIEEHFQKLPLENSVLAYSGLRRSHRQRFRHLGFKTQFILLHGDHDVICQRIQNRSDHFMPSLLLSSQFDAFEPPTEESDVVSFNIEKSPSELSRIIKQSVQKKFK